jgi:hypothetical protein
MRFVDNTHTLEDRKSEGGGNGKLHDALEEDDLLTTAEAEAIIYPPGNSADAARRKKENSRLYEQGCEQYLAMTDALHEILTPELRRELQRESAKKVIAEAYEKRTLPWQQLNFIMALLKDIATKERSHLLAAYQSRRQNPTPPTSDKGGGPDGRKNVYLTPTRRRVLSSDDSNRDDDSGSEEEQQNIRDDSEDEGVK